MLITKGFHWYLLIISGIVMSMIFGRRAFDRFNNSNMNSTKQIEDPRCKAYDSIWCDNGALLEEAANGFICKCPEGYYGEDCSLTYEWQYPLWLKRIFEIFEHIDLPNILWNFIPFTSKIRSQNIYKYSQDIVMKFNTNEAIEIVEPNMQNTRILPPARPSNCLINKRLPSLDTLYDRIVLKNSDRFSYDLNNKNVIYAAFYKYFMMQFFEPDFNPTVSASQLYGNDEKTQKELRTFSNGKLKTSVINKRHFAPFVSSEKQLEMSYLSSSWFGRAISQFITGKNQKPKRDFTEHPWTNTDPMIFVMSTLWIREHNRVCDVLVQDRPYLTDKQIYHIAKRIVVGEMMTIMMNDVMKANTGVPFSLKYEPASFRDKLQYTNSHVTPLELYLINMWPSDLPAYDKNTKTESLNFTVIRQVFENGVSDAVKYMIDRKIAMVTSNNYDVDTKPLVKLAIKLSREKSVQSFNNYRRKLGLLPYSSFEKLTRNKETAAELKSLYQSVEDVELLTGMLVEDKTNRVVPTTTVMTNSFIINSIITNPLYSEYAWNKDTFGGSRGFQMVQTANIETLICNNLADGCVDLKVDLFAQT